MYCSATGCVRIVLKVQKTNTFFQTATGDALDILYFVSLVELLVLSIIFGYCWINCFLNLLVSDATG